MRSLGSTALSLDRISIFEIDTGNELLLIYFGVICILNPFLFILDHNFEVASELNIRSIPSLVMIKDGKVVSETIGSVSLSILEKQIAHILD